MMGPRAEKWKETHRQAMGIATGRGDKDKLPWFCRVYRLHEARMERGRIVEHRERLVYGKAVTGHDVPEPAFHALMRTVVDGVAVLSEYAEAEDDRATSRRKVR
jgi:hypothetical protein